MCGQKSSTYSRVKGIGRGSYGYVHLVKRNCDDKLFAEKEIMIVEDYEESNTEIEILLSLDHPNIIKIFDIQTAKSKQKLSIIMEYAEGGAFYAELKQRGKSNEYFSQSEVLWIMFQLSDALQYAHSKGIAHRDLKPLNILIKNGEMKICDFGAGRILHHMGDHMSTVIGTRAYVAPEVSTGTYKLSADIWSLGIIFFEIMFLTRPRSISEMYGVECSICLLKLRKQGIFYSNKLNKIIASMLAIHPSDRPTARTVFENIQSMLDRKKRTDRDNKPPKNSMFPISPMPPMSPSPPPDSKSKPPASKYSIPEPFKRVSPRSPKPKPYLACRTRKGEISVLSNNNNMKILKSFKGFGGTISQMGEWGNYLLSTGDKGFDLFDISSYTHYSSILTPFHVNAISILNGRGVIGTPIPPTLPPSVAVGGSKGKMRIYNTTHLLESAKKVHNVPNFLIPNSPFRPRGFMRSSSTKYSRRMVLNQGLLLNQGKAKSKQRELGKQSPVSSKRYSTRSPSRYEDVSESTREKTGNEESAEKIGEFNIGEHTLLRVLQNNMSTAPSLWSTSTRGDVQIWDLHNRRISSKHSPYTPPNPAFLLTPIPIHNAILTSSLSKQSTIHDHSGSTMYQFTHKREIYSGYVEGHQLVTGEEEGYITFWDLRSCGDSGFSPVKEFTLGERTIWSILGGYNLDLHNFGFGGFGGSSSSSSSSNQLLLGGDEGLLWFYDCDSQKVIRTLDLGSEITHILPLTSTIHYQLFDIYSLLFKRFCMFQNFTFYVLDPNPIMGFIAQLLEELYNKSQNRVKATQLKSQNILTSNIN